MIRECARVNLADCQLLGILHDKIAKCLEGKEYVAAHIRW